MKRRDPFLRALVAGIVLCLAPAASAQTQGDGARVYWKTLAGANAVTFWPVFAGGNASPLDPSHSVTPDTNFDALLAVVGAHRVLAVAGRSSTMSVFLPVGRLSGALTDVASEPAGSSRGFGDPVLQLTLNLVGAPAIRNLVQLARYEPKYTIDLLGGVAFPIGEHSRDQAVNLSQDRFYGRIGAPIMIALAPWVPGKRTTVEVLPAIWFFQDVDQGPGSVLKNEALLQVEAHLTRDLTDAFWASLDSSWFKGAKPERNGVEGKSLNTPGVGFTLGFQINQNLAINTSYFATVGDSAPTDLRSDEFRVMFTYGWHKLLEGVKRLGQ
jgi:hypothetical protein